MGALIFRTFICCDPFLLKNRKIIISIFNYEWDSIPVINLSYYVNFVLASISGVAFAISVSFARIWTYDIYTGIYILYPGYENAWFSLIMSVDDWEGGTTVILCQEAKPV